ncbi:MAG: phosphate/phosphite/phosphonate ABC transporter substrate-binding protein [Deltaproteobacteria bacterium]|nr:phosphate/phosphite/phosphonate ABC transporter substrate-binding protein [Deltaproteobacteria bacterium]
MKVLLLGCLLPVMFALATNTPVSAAMEKAYTIAVIPSAPPVTLHKQWTPFVERLSSKTGLEFRLKMYEKMAEFERDIWSGTPDFIFSSPIQTVVARKTNGYVPLVRGGKDIAVGLFVRKEAPFKNIDDLSGRTISFVGNKNLCSVFVQHLLGEHKIKMSFTREYAGSTRNVIINVLLGKSDAGAVFIPELARESEDTRKQLREILVTPAIAPHPLSAHPRVPRAAQEAVKNASLAIAAASGGSELFRALRMDAPVAADYDRDYRILEEIDIVGLSNWGK